MLSRLAAVALMIPTLAVAAAPEPPATAADLPSANYALFIYVSGVPGANTVVAIDTNLQFTKSADCITAEDAVKRSLLYEGYRGAVHCIPLHQGVIDHP